MRHWPNLTGGHCSSMESCVTTGTGVALGVDKWVEMLLSETPFAARGEAWRAGRKRKEINCGGFDENISGEVRGLEVLCTV